MTIKFQYNKTSLQSLNKQLNIRLRALPTLKNKEAALRFEVKKAKDKAALLARQLKELLKENDESAALWNEFNKDLILIDRVEISTIKIAGVKIPVLKEVIFHEHEFSIFKNPKWFLQGISLTKEIAELGIEERFYHKKMELLDHARRKTTQKVNLYEKVQIPGYQIAILKIKRFLEDEENLSKSSQKIIKKRQLEKLEELL